MLVQVRQPSGRSTQLRCAHVVECHSLTVPSSEPVRMSGSSGWKHTVAMLWAWPSSVCSNAQKTVGVVSVRPGRSGWAHTVQVLRPETCS